MTVEIMSPAGSFESLQAAIKAGCHAVYFGIKQLNMRARAANNFTLEELKEVVAICEKNNVKSYLTVNTILYDDDISLLHTICDAAKSAGVTAIIASDIAAMLYAKSIELPVHISTQANVSNTEAVKFYAQYCNVIVLARELTLQQITDICQTIKKENIIGPDGDLIKIEVFAHGALCVSISGKCYMSLAMYNASANRGACVQPCRRAYRLVDEETGAELVVDNKYIMSPKDLCTISMLDKLIEAGVSVLKLEGRGRSPDYTYKVTKVYREAVDSYYAGTYTQEKVQEWTTELEKVFNRGFWQKGYYQGKELGEWCEEPGSQATTKKIYLGKAKNYFAKAQVGEFILEADTLAVGDTIIITGPTTGVIETVVKELYIDDKPVPKASKDDLPTIKITEKVRANDKLFKVVAR